MFVNTYLLSHEISSATPQNPQCFVSALSLSISIGDTQSNQESNVRYISFTFMPKTTFLISFSGDQSHPHSIISYVCTICLGQFYIHCTCLKKAPTLKRESSKLHWTILTTFGRNIQNTPE